MLRAEQFTDQAQDTARRAFEIFQRYGHGQVDTAHVLRAMLDQPETGVPQLLHDLNADQALIKQRLDEVLNGFPQATGDGPGDGQAYITPHVKQVLDLASQEASRHQDELISNRHMLFAILSERDTAVARLLSEAGITSDGLAGVGNLPPGGQ